MGVFSVLVIFVLFNIVHSDDQETNVSKKQSLPKPNIPPGAFVALYFDGPSISASNLVLSTAKKDGSDASIAKYDGQWAVEVEESSAFTDDYTLVLKSKAKHHGIAWKLMDTIKFDMDELVIQYEVKFANGIDCGGAYIKLLSSSPDLKLTEFNDKTPYTIMFGPDKCGLDHKFHFIIRYRNPKTGLYEEKKAKRVPVDIETYFSDRRTHLYTLVMRSDNSFERYIDQVKVQTGNLLTDMEESINPPEEIDDPNDKRPADWDDREKIPDPNAEKPDDWDDEAPEMIPDATAVKPDGWLDDEPLMVPDLSTEKPSDWDSDEHGDWEPPQIENPKCSEAPGCGEWSPPMIKNPNYKGKWSPPLIPNPAFKGIWKPAKIPNPNYFHDEEPFKNLTPVSAIGLELWSMTENIVFDNFLIVDSLKKANAFAKETWVIKAEAERRADPKAQSVVDAVRETYREKPIFVILIGITCTLPFLLCLWWVCRPAKKSSVALHKKTDSSTPDDEPTKYDSKQPENKPKAVHEEEVEEEASEDDLVQVSTAVEAEQEGDTNTSRTKADLESDSDDENSAEPQATQPEKQTIRKRRSRKE